LHKTNDENQATKHVIYQNMGVINKGGLDDGTGICACLVSCKHFCNSQHWSSLNIFSLFFILSHVSLVSIKLQISPLKQKHIWKTTFFFH